MQSPPRTLPVSVEQALLEHTRGKRLTPLCYFGSEQFAFVLVQQGDVQNRFAVKQGKVLFVDNVAL